MTLNTGSNKDIALMPDGTGSVGIGDLDAAAKLNVVGQVRASNEAGETNYIEMDHNGSNSFVNHTGSGNMQFRHGGSTISVMNATGLTVGGSYAPGTKLDVNGTKSANALRLRSGDSSGGENGGNQMLFSFDGGANYSHAIRSRHHSTDGNGNAIDFYTWNHNQAANAGTVHAMTLSNGKVGIGDIINPTKDLEVGGNARINGTIEVIELHIDPNGTWADYVFEEDYQLRPLSEVSDFIKENKHLPEIPSAKEVSEQGYNQTEINAKLLQKIEELTLYMIELEQKNKELTKKVSKLESNQ